MQSNPNQYPQQPPYQPGQQRYMPPTLPPRPPKKKLHFWRYVALVVGALIVLSFCHAAATGTLSSDVATPTPDTALASSSTPMPTTAISQAATPAPTQAPTLTPTPKPTQPPAAPPTQPPAKPAQPAPTSPPAHQTTYDTNASGGTMVYNPPADFCTTRICVTTFWTATSGYVVVCADGEYSHSGGVRGACSRNGGVSATVYAH